MGYSREFIELNINYARKVSEIGTMGFIVAVSSQTCIRRTVLGAGFSGQPERDTYWEQFAQDPGSDPVQTILDLQSQIPDCGKDENRVRSGILSATLPDDKGLSLIHFSSNPAEAHPLGDEGLKNRAAEMTQLLTLLKAYGPVNIGMFSWLLDGRFSSLFPSETEYQNNPNGFFQSLAIWGQYLRADGSLNTKRAAVLIDNSQKAGNLGELQTAHPKKALQSRSPAQAMYQMYGIHI